MAEWNMLFKYIYKIVWTLHTKAYTRENASLFCFYCFLGAWPRPTYKPARVHTENIFLIIGKNILIPLHFSRWLPFDKAMSKTLITVIVKQCGLWNYVNVGVLIKLVRISPRMVYKSVVIDHGEAHKPSGFMFSSIYFTTRRQDRRQPNYLSGVFNNKC